MKNMMKKLFAVLFAALFVFSFTSCASKDDEEDYDYDYTEDESLYINDIAPVSTDDFLADIGPVDLDPVYFLRKKGKKVVPREVTKIALVPRTNAVEMHFRDGPNEVAIILRKGERDTILAACNTFLQQYEAKTLPHTKINRKNAYFNSRCSLWYGVLSPSNGCEKNRYYMICEFINKKPYLLMRFVPTENTAGMQDFTPKISLYMSPSQIRDFVEAMDQKHLESLIEESKQKAYTY